MLFVWSLFLRFTKTDIFLVFNVVFIIILVGLNRDRFYMVRHSAFLRVVGSLG